MTSSSIVGCEILVPEEYEKVALDTVITNLDLGKIETSDTSTAPTSEKILNFLRTKNSKLDILQVEVDGTPSLTEAVIKVKSGSVSYIEGGSVTVTFTLNSVPKINITTVITNLDLGEILVLDINSPSNAEILLTVQSKNPSLIVTQVEVDGTPSLAEAVIKVKSGSTSYIEGGSVTVTYTLGQKTVALNESIKETNLGEIIVDDITIAPTNDQILAAAKAKNSSLVLSQVEVDGTPSLTEAVIKVKSDAVSYVVGNTINVTYTLVAKVALNSVVTVLELGEIVVDDTTIAPTNDQILAAAKAKNSNLDTSQVEVDGSPSLTEAVIKVKSGSTSYVEGGSVTVTYTLGQKTVALNESIKETNLGEIVVDDTTIAPTNDQILAAAKAKNSNLDTSQVEVDGTPSLIEATIKVKSGSVSYIEGGSVVVTYTLNTATT
ncbi:hypothetical protein [Spiroplasma taiwanense]|uniref:Uncharacterized protein n=1 Tax=Spiroplasma taiwanense CT-1 TaxID=1276220 RepID=S5LZY9_9MOLU|nr:hypothetical protein [Spiroplasma taiwanense]AGR41307.1 hypothetical protein STAIW_v1c06900 [Spiroplasma taiwanense CT-1]